MKLPGAFAEQMQILIGKREYDNLKEALEKDSPVSIRLNEKKISKEKEEFSERFGKGQYRTNTGDKESGNTDKWFLRLPSQNRVRWSTSGYYVDKRPPFTFDPLFHAGCYYVQEASSMFLEQVIQSYVKEPSLALDLCAAPGGKSTHISSVLPQGSLLVANEVIPNRACVLAENLMKWGNDSVIVTRNDPADFRDMRGVFDVIFADVPCSGEGMFRKDPGAIGEWSIENVRMCSQRQRRIISDVWPALKEGGILVYSTCTYNPEEDEKNIAWIMKEYGGEPLSVACLPEWNLVGNLSDKDFPVYRFFPHKVEGEGFFLAVLRKPQDSYTDTLGKESRYKKKKGKKQQMPVKVLPVVAEAKEWLINPARYSIQLKENRITAFPEVWNEVCLVMQKSLRVVHAGIVLGEVKGKDLIPHHSLAMSTEFQRNAFPQVELSYKEAVSYLRKGNIEWNGDFPRGYITANYKNIPLGFIKNIGNRVNNLYPQEWRIRSSYLPEGAEEWFL